MDHNKVHEQAYNYQPNRKYTYRDYLNWTDDIRREIIDGKVYEMTATPSRKHQEVLLALATAFSNYLKDKTYEVYIAPFDVRLPEVSETDEKAINVVQPDLSVFCDKDKLDEKGAVGSPDLIIEVISPSTLKKDMTVKKSLYEKMGVQEFWLVYPMEGIITTYELNKQERYSPFETYGKGDCIKIGIFEDFSIDLTTIFRE
ncbi:Uma2 family endonuclease [Scopulibacillus cellulosilyticus]|uniref:Uma2 family endonuclease n=1 Tax=Scopulibacillus cellulosilyticus TaxID=2665665 RepID=A0ABW2PWN8_9BACL